MASLNGKVHIFSGNVNPELAQAVADDLNKPLGTIHVNRFSDGEVNVKIDEHVRGHHIYIIQSTCSPTNDNLMELLVMVDAFKRSAVKSITTIIPYYGYSRQDRRPDHTRTPISSRLVADLLQAAGVDQMLTIDIHSGQQQGFFNIPMINLSASNEIIEDIVTTYADSLNDPVIVSPDIGGVARARSIAKYLDTEIAIIDKRRPNPNESEVMNIIGSVEGRDCVIVDDIIDTAGTLCRAADALKYPGGAETVAAYATHPVFSGEAFSKIERSELDRVVVTDTIPIDQYTAPDQIRVLSISSLIAETLRRIRAKQSVSQMYQT